MPPQRRNPPIINAPPIVTALALSLVVAHIIRLLAGQWLDGLFLDYGAIFPERFWGWLGFDMTPRAYPPYSNVFAAVIPLAGTAYVHGSWAHLLMNSIMLVAVGKPVYSALQQVALTRMAGNWTFLGVFFLSVIGGSLAHLVSHIPYGPPAIGASGGVSGLLAAVLLLQQGEATRLLSRPYLTVSAVFIAANFMLAFLGPSMFGSSIAWQAHIGGYVAGALLFRYLLYRHKRTSV